MRNLKKTLALILVAVFCLSLCPAAFAAEAESTTVVQEVSAESTDAVQPRKIVGYINHYHNGDYYGEFKVPTDWALSVEKKFSIQTQDFDADTELNISVYNSKGELCSPQGGIWTKGNESTQGFSMSHFIKGDTYTVKFNMYKGTSDDGWVGIWIF